MSLNPLNKALLKAFGIVLTFVAGASSASASMTTLKQVQVSNGSQIDLLFDGRVGKSQARTEFFNDVIQVSLTDVAVYPAKISSVNGGPLVKIFAYQYAPKLVRCRLTVKGKAEDFKDKLQISTSGKILSLKIGDVAINTDRIAVAAAHPAPAEAENTKSEKKEKAKVVETAPSNDSVQNALLEKVMNSAPSKPIAVTAEKKAAESNDSSDIVERKSERKARAEKLALGGGAKSLPSPMGVLAKLLGVIGVFGAMALGAKKVLHGRVGGGDKKLHARIARSAATQQNGWLGALGGLAKNAAAGLGRKDKMIEVLSTHYLGPKKSIAVVRVMGRTLVLGVTNDSINLISQIAGSTETAEEEDLSAEMDLDGIFAQAAHADALSAQKAAAPKPMQTTAPKVAASAYANANSAFSAMVQQEVKKPAATIAAASSQANVRNQIRSRLEGLKQL